MKPFTSKHCAQYLTKKSPLNQERKIIGEDTFDFVIDKDSGNLVAGLSLDGGSSMPSDTNNRLVLTPSQASETPMDSDNFIDQFYPMTVKKDSVSGGKTYYGLKKPSKK